ncbi:DUF6783 domain-containing protein [Candidatus Ventrimonas sp. KK005]
MSWKKILPPNSYCFRACLKIHSHHLHAPLYGIFGSHSVNIANYPSPATAFQLCQ